MSINKYAFIQTEDQTYNFYKVENGRSKILATGIKDPTIKVTIRTVQKPIEQPQTMAIARSDAIMPLDLVGEDTFIEEQEMDIETSPEEPGFLSALFDDICGGVSSAVTWVKDGIMTLFSPSEEQVEQAKQVEQASAKAVKASEAKKIAVNGVGTPFFQTIEQAMGDVPNRKAVAELTTNSIMYSSSTATLCYPSDLLADGNPYNGLYTVFFISEHNESTIAQVSTFTTDKKYVNNQGSAFANMMGKLSLKDQNNMRYGIGLIGSITAAKTVADAASKLTESVLGNGSALAKVINGAAKVAGLTATAALIAPPVSHMVTNFDEIKEKGVETAFKEAMDQNALTKNNLDYKQLKIAIALPTPQIDLSSVITWSDANMQLQMGSAKFASMLIRDNGSGDIFAGVDKANFATSLPTIASRFADKVKNNMEQIVEAGGEAVVAMATSNPKVGGIVSKMTGTTANTRKELLFQDIPFREFSFKYQLMARSPEEMQSIESIIRVFKYHAHPELSKNEYLYRYPAQFDIVHYFGDKVNPHMPRHTTCVLTKIDVDYGGGQQYMSVHYDGSPVSIQLTLAFKEIAVLTKDSIAQGY